MSCCIKQYRKASVVVRTALHEQTLRVQKRCLQNESCFMKQYHKASDCCRSYRELAVVLITFEAVVLFETKIRQNLLICSYLFSFTKHDGMEG
jgi:hypothetical protein